MGLTTKSRFPSFQGPTEAVVPTPTFSGKLTDNAADSINPYTLVGPGEGGAGQTYEEVVSGTPAFTGTLQLLFNDTSVPANTAIPGATITDTLPAPTLSGATHAVRTVGAGGYLNVTDPALLNLGTQDFTIAFNILIPTGVAVNGGFFEEVGSGGDNPKWYNYFGSSTNVLNFWYPSSGAASVNGSMTIPAIVADTWYEFRVVRSSNTVTYYWNGVQMTGTNATYATVGNTPSNNAWNFGKNAEVGGAISQAYFDDIRFWIGDAVVPT